MSFLRRFLASRSGRTFLAVWALVTLSLTVFNLRAFAQDSAPAEATPAVQAEVKPDPTGGTYGTAADAKDASGTTFVPSDEKEKAEFDAQSAKEPLATKLAGSVGHVQASTNLMWVLICGFLVMFMQAGFAMVEVGFCRAKHAAHVVMTNFMIYPIGMLGFWICGFAFMFGNAGAIGAFGGAELLNGSFKVGELSLIGTKGFFLNPSVYDISIYALFLFQMVFMDTTCTIPTGAMAERWRFAAFCVYGFFISMICYPIYGHWVWGGGWLAHLGDIGIAGQKFGNGVVDFAGSSVVHAVGGFVGLAGAIVIGPRLGKFKDGKAVAIPGHNIPMAVVGTFILCFGWFGFNAGSTLSGNDMRIAVIATNTMLASAGGALSAMLFWHAKTKKYDPGMMVNGMLAGLVGITAPCAFVDSIASVVIGLIAGLLVIWSILFWEKKGIDDPVGAISVHGVCGVYGLLCVGFFADGSYGAGLNGVEGPVKGLFAGGGAGQLIAQLIGALVCIAWAFGTALIFFKLQSKFMKLRPTAEEELAGLDIPEMGVLAYPEFVHKESV
jgi:Amt family ammonium transporter